MAEKCRNRVCVRASAITSPFSSPASTAFVCKKIKSYIKHIRPLKCGKSVSFVTFSLWLLVREETCCASNV